MIDRLIDWLIYSDHACAGVRREKFMHQSVPGCSSCGGRCGGGRRCSMSSLTTSQETHSSPGRKSSRTSTHWWGGAEREGEEGWGGGEVYDYGHSDNEFPLLLLHRLRPGQSSQFRYFPGMKMGMLLTGRMEKVLPTKRRGKPQPTVENRR